MERSGYFVRHRATILEGSLAGRILGGGTIEVNSSHHQAVADPGPLVVTGHAEDGTIEVCEDPTRTFWLGVQWHPEQPEQPSGPLLFGALVQAAAAYRSGRAEWSVGRVDEHILGLGEGVERVRPELAPQP